MVRYTQSREMGMDKLWWERLRDEGKRRKGQRERGRKNERIDRRTGGTEERKEAAETGKEGEKGTERQNRRAGLSLGKGDGFF